MGGALASRLGLGSKREVEKEQLVPSPYISLYLPYVCPISP